jgi:hypothetical protein
MGYGAILLYRPAMTSRISTRLGLAVLATVASVVPMVAADAPNTLTAAEKAAGWRLLFDGSTMAGWRGYNKPDTSGLRWLVKDGAVCLPPADGADTRGHRDIITADTFGDFDLTWQWQVQPGSNSGLKYFVVESGPLSTMPGIPTPRSARSGRPRRSTT